MQPTKKLVIPIPHQRSQQKKPSHTTQYLINAANKKKLAIPRQYLIYTANKKASHTTQYLINAANKKASHTNTSSTHPTKKASHTKYNTSSIQPTKKLVIPIPHLCSQQKS